MSGSRRAKVAVCDHGRIYAAHAYTPGVFDEERRALNFIHNEIDEGAIYKDMLVEDARPLLFDCEQCGDPQ